MNTPRVKPRILLLDGDGNDRALTQHILTASLPDLSIAAVDAADFDSRLAVRDFDLVISERRLSWSDSARLMERLKGAHPDCPVIILTRQAQDYAITDDLERGAFAVIFKDSAGLLQLPHMVRRALAPHRRGTDAEPGMLERLPVGIFLLGREGAIREANRGATEILGLDDPDEARGLNLSGRLDSHPAQRRLQLLLDGDGEPVDMEARLRRPDGENCWVRLRVWPTAGDPGRFEGTLENISDYKKTESELARQAAELGRSNTELEQFAYVVSHDLQEPLSLIQRYSELVTESKALSRDKQAAGHLKQVLESSERMQEMIDGILEYSRVETRGTPFKSVDFDKVLGDAVSNLAAAVESSEADIRYSDMPTLNADGGQMLQLFQNLIGNAIKFRSADRKPVISVSATEQREHWRFTVKDNGIGIEPAQRERIFSMFQRLHTGEEYSGTGIGLAVCRSIVNRHGGEIWVDSVPGRGSEFHFTISRWL